MTLNAVITLILRFFYRISHFQADYITVVEDRPNVHKILSPSSSLLGENYNAYPAARFLCDSWASWFFALSRGYD